MFATSCIHYKQEPHEPVGFTHLNPMSGEEVLKCTACVCDRNVAHILTECGDMAEVKQMLYDVENVTLLLRNISVTEILEFLWKRI